MSQPPSAPRPPASRRSIARRIAPAAGITAVLAIAGGAAVAAINPALTPADIAPSSLPASWVGELRSTQGETCVFDFDGDKIKDAFVSTHGAGWRLLKGQAGGTFVEVERFPATDRHGCATGDFGGMTADGTPTGPDGRVDIYAGIGACQGTCSAEFPNELWLQQPNGKYLPAGQDQLLGVVPDGNKKNAGSEAARKFGIADVHGRGREPIAIDVNKDGLLDIFLGNDQGVNYPSPNRLYINKGGSFQEQPLPGEAEVGSTCSAVADFDGNGFADLVNCGETKLQVFRNEAGTLTEVAGALGLSSIADPRDAEFADINKDGKLDLVIARHTKIELRINRNNTFGTVDFSKVVDGGTEVAIGDADGDGWKDIYAVMWNNKHGSGKGKDILFRNLGTGTAATWGLEETPVPLATEGNGDTAAALPNWNGTNRAAFLVTNGKFDDPGPYQLLFMNGPSTGGPVDETPTTTTPTTATPTTTTPTTSTTTTPTTTTPTASTPTTKTTETTTTPATAKPKPAWCKKYPKLKTTLAKQLKAAKKARVKASRSGTAKAKIKAAKRVKAIQLAQKKAVKRYRATCTVKRTTERIAFTVSSIG